jgi:hypothetical protein
MHLELFVPGLHAGRPVPGRLPALELLIARARAAGDEAHSAERWLAKAFGIEGDLPAGALTLLAEDQAPGSERWMRVDPAHLLQQRDLLVLAPPPAIRVGKDEAARICMTLNAHFGEELEIRAATGDAWCARGAVPETLPTAAPLDAAGRPVPPIPAGTTSERWHALQNEAQMLMHTHPVNAMREARGERTLNSLWFWGAGTLPQGIESHWRSVSAHDPVARGLALAAKAQARRLPASAGAWLAAAPPDGRHLVYLEELRIAHALEDGAGWIAALERLESDWIVPLLAALREDRIGMVSLHVPDGTEARSYELIRGDLRRFWRRPKPLGA